LATKKRKVVKCIPDLFGSLNDIIEMFDEQCSMVSNMAHNTNEDMYALVDKFREQVTEKQSVNYVFWKVAKLFTEFEYKRKAVMEYLLKAFTPYEFCVYQLMDNEEIVYVGKSYRLNERLNSHISLGKKFNDVRVYFCKDEREQDVVENTCIMRLWPKYNKTVNLSLADKNMCVPEFVALNESRPKFILTSHLDIKVDLREDYHLLQNIGFIHKSTVNKPYWKK